MEVKIKNNNELIEADWTVEDGVMVVSPKEVKFEPKEGDVITIKNKSIPFTLIVKSMGKSKTVFSHALLFSNEIFSKDDFISYENLRPATEEEKQKLFDKLAEEGYEFDFDKNELVKIKWKPKLIGEDYYNPSFNEFEFEPYLYSWDEDDIDSKLYEMGWVFRTKQECQAFCDRLNKALENIKP